MVSATTVSVNIAYAIGLEMFIVQVKAAKRHCALAAKKYNRYYHETKVEKNRSYELTCKK